MQVSAAESSGNTVDIELYRRTDRNLTRNNGENDGFGRRHFCDDRSFITYIKLDRICRQARGTGLDDSKQKFGKTISRRGESCNTILASQQIFQVRPLGQVVLNLTGIHTPFKGFRNRHHGLASNSGHIGGIGHDRCVGRIGRVDRDDLLLRLAIQTRLMECRFEFVFNFRLLSFAATTAAVFRMTKLSIFLLLAFLFFRLWFV